MRRFITSAENETVVPVFANEAQAFIKTGKREADKENTSPI